MISVVYFSFTTLATVGYGDYHPVSNPELLVGGVYILFGVTVFSFIMGNFIEMLVEFKTVTAENEDSQDLYKWLNVLARFNNGRQLPKDMVQNIEDYFNYYWKNDKNYACLTESGERFLSEIPKYIRISVTLKNKMTVIDFQGLPLQEFPLPVWQLLPHDQGRPAEGKAQVEVLHLG